MKTRILFLFLSLLFSGRFIYAQRAEAEALLSQAKIRIGEQIELKLAVRYHEGTKKSVVIWPEFRDTITQGVEIIKQDSIKTILTNRTSVLYKQSRSIIITAFDSGTYVIPPQIFIVDKDTAYTAAILLYVNTIPVDTTKPIKDIKGIYDVPPPPPLVKTNNPQNWMCWALAGITVILAFILILYFTTRKKPIPFVQNFSRQLLPHEKVLEKLAELGRKKPWLHGELKSYHIALTEILRAWIVERYQIHALEMTTVQIIRLLHSKHVDSSAVMQLERVLRTSDMVKFAKGIPDVEENEIVLQLAMNFVQATAVYPEPPIQPVQ